MSFGQCPIHSLDVTINRDSKTSGITQMATILVVRERYARGLS